MRLSLHGLCTRWGRDMRTPARGRTSRPQDTADGTGYRGRARQPRRITER
ncbi:hypothetical protein RSPO_m00097 (plasmid) [Ralstonia solanacearum Po82]|uniref:Uncharacterized protein n=1 Tax=Ralstonia solanacearum (strain Po82) TaxID=1031711 RepID=F6G774_RALS8|nr:hypothetical protein RSPO_m00097 [Ralstonia solanacearum Po82]